MTTVFKFPIILLTTLAVIVISNGLSQSESAQKPKNAEFKNSFRVMSYNIHHGEGMDGKVDLERIARIIRQQDADIVALQEVDVGVKRSNGLNIAKELARLTGLEYYSFGKNIDHQGGSYGNATLSRYPIVRENNTHLTRIRPEQRGILQTVIDVEGRRLLLMNTHLDHNRDDEERVVNINEIRNEILPEYSTKAVIIAGDFNDVPESTTYKMMKDFMIDAWEVSGEGKGLTIPPDKPERRIDFIFHNKEIVTSKAWVYRTLASDHLPLIVECYFQ